MKEASANGFDPCTAALRILLSFVQSNETSVCDRPVFIIKANNIEHT